MKHVMHIVWDGDHAGVLRYVSKVASSKDWQKYKHSIIIITQAGDIVNHKELPIPVHFMDINTNTQVRTCFLQLHKYVIEQDVDIIHSHCDTHLFLSQLRLFKNVKLVYTQQGDSSVRISRQLLLRFLWICNSPYWDKVIQNSHFTERVFLNKSPFPEEKTAVLCNPLLETVETKKRSLNKTINIGSVGRLETVKGNDLFLRAIPAILKIIPKAHFHIFGDGTEKQNLINLTRQLGISKSVVFHEFTSNPLKEMQKMDCLTVPSRQESLGLVALEAMSVGTPIAAFNNIGISDFLENAKNGNLADAANKDSPAKAIVNCVNKNNWQRLSKNAIQTVLKKYSLNKHINNMEELYDDCYSAKQQEEIA